MVKLRKIETNGITNFHPLPGNTNEWFYGMDYACGDLYEAEHIFGDGHPLKGRKLCLLHYPDGQTFFPVPMAEEHYCESPVFFEDGIFILDVDFPNGRIRILRFDCKDHQTTVHVELPLSTVKDCYNLQLHVSPPTLTRQCDPVLEIIWPEKASIAMKKHESFFLRDGERLFFNCWYEEGEGGDYKFWEETIVKDLNGNEIERLPGDVRLMPNGELWHLK
ncbi:MAG: hypothetical protein K6A92_01235 [Lachnospiraceae bacterium]|nr:hypothetical protein [Lachnospiraceae bacterium]